MSVMERDRGLVRRVGALGLGGAVFNTVVGAGIFVVPAALARDIGAAAPLAYAVCMAAMGAVVLCFAAAGSRVPGSGGPYDFVEAAFGPAAAFTVGVLVWLGGVLAAAGIASAVAEGLARFVPALAPALPRALVIVALFATLATVNIAGVAPGAGLVGLLTIPKLAPLLLLVVVAVPHVRLANLAVAAPPLHSFGRAIILALFAFQGMETGLGVSGETVDPARNVPRGLLGAMGAVALLYVAIQAAAQGVLGPALARSPAPLADAMAVAAPPLTILMLAGATVSMLGYLASDTLGAPRVLFAFAQSGLVPRGLARVHPRTRAPYRAILFHVTVGGALAITGSFTELAVLSSLATVVVYALGCLAALRLQRRDIAMAGPPLRIPGLPAVALVGVLAMVFAASNATWPEGLGCAGVIAATLIWYAAVRRFRRPAATPAA